MFPFIGIIILVTLGFSLTHVRSLLILDSQNSFVKPLLLFQHSSLFLSFDPILMYFWFCLLLQEMTVGAESCLGSALGPVVYWA
uniref:Transmembrane protein n=1 Tax=Arabidopsis thaliana TaxID=3702 RepID=Q0WMA3_ARATH|nr:hypothetical protein [Arabidopsis thaliana]